MHRYCKCGTCRVSWMREGKTPSCFERNEVDVLTSFLAKTSARLPAIQAGGNYEDTDWKNDLTAARAEHGRLPPRQEWIKHLISLRLKTRLESELLTLVQREDTK